MLAPTYATNTAGQTQVRGSSHSSVTTISVVPSNASPHASKASAGLAVGGQRLAASEASSRSANHVHEVEHREVEGDQDAANGGTHEGDEQWLEQAR